VKTVLTMFRDAREMPHRFWESYAIILLVAALISFAVHDEQLPLWWGLILALTAAYAIFAGLMVVYRLGMVRAYNETHAMLLDARNAMADGHADMLVIANKLGEIEGHFQGPS
jgi:hypothetical protein